MKLSNPNRTINSVSLWSPQSFFWRGLVLAILLLGVALRLYQLGHDSLWLDEIITQEMTLRSVPNMLRLVGTYSDHPPLFYLLAYQNRIFGFSDFAARLTATAAGILTIPVIIVLARKLWGAPAGLIAGLLLAVWPTHLHFSQEARQYALLTFFCSLSMYWLYQSITHRRRSAWIGYGIASVGGLYSHNFAFLWLASQVLFVMGLWLKAWLSGGRSSLRTYGQRVVLPFFITLSLVGVFYLPWLPSLLTQSKRLISGVSTSAIQGQSNTFHKILKMSLRFFAENEQSLKTSFTYLSIAGLAVLIKQRRWNALMLIASSLVGPFLMIGMLTSSHFFSARYLFPLLIPIILLISAALRPLIVFPITRLHFSERTAGGLTLAFLVLIGVYFIPFIRDYYQEDKEGWHDVARYLQANMGPDDIILADGMLLHKAGDAERVQHALGYYLPDELILPIEKESISAIRDNLHPGAKPWGVLWYQGRLKNRETIPEGITLIDYRFLVILQLENASGDWVKDTTRIVEAMLQLQPRQESEADMQDMLSELYQISKEEPSK